MKRLKTIILLTLISLCFGNFGQKVNFAQEKTISSVINELEKIKIDEVSKVLNQEERAKIVRLITKLYIKIVRQKQSDYISPQTPLYLLLKTNYPNITEKEEERGISLSSIVKFLNSKSENRETINSVLMEQKSRKCS